MKNHAKYTVGTSVSFGDVDRFQVKAFPRRQGSCMGEHSTPPRNELAAVGCVASVVLSAELLKPPFEFSLFDGQPRSENGIHRCM